MPGQIETDSSNQPIYDTPGLWGDAVVRVQGEWMCPIPMHSLEQVDHYDLGPTGFLMCAECLGFADEPGWPDANAT